MLLASRGIPVIKISIWEEGFTSNPPTNDFSGTGDAPPSLALTQYDPPPTHPGRKHPFQEKSPAGGFPPVVKKSELPGRNRNTTPAFPHVRGSGAFPPAVIFQAKGMTCPIPSSYFFCFNLQPDHTDMNRSIGICRIIFKIFIHDLFDES